MNWKNDITRLLNIEYPIIQAPMFGSSTPEMVAAATKAKVLGSLPLGDLSSQKCIEIIRTTKTITNKAFAVNIFVNKIPELTESLKQEYNQARQFIQKLAINNNLEVNLPTIDEIVFTDYHSQVDAIIEENCKIVSFTFGNLDAESIQKLKENNTILIGTCTTVSEALILEQSGIDIICVQGIEAGGHRGSFEKDDSPKIGGLSILSKVHDAVKVPLIYAGGLYNAKTIVATKILGAQGFQVGSLLLGSKESALQNFEKEHLRKANEHEIVLTRSFSGRYARGISNTFIKTIDNSSYLLPYPYQNKLTGALRKVAKLNKNTDFLSIWTGQSLGNFSEDSTTKIIQKLIDEVNSIY